MKNTLEELKAAQSKGCRIEVKDKDGNWMLVSIPVESLIGFDIYTFRIHPADEWKDRLPRLRDGAEWHRNDFTNEMLEGGYRPLLLGELWIKGDQIMRRKGVWHEAGKNEWESEDLLGAVADAETMPCRTRRPVPPEFLHPDELAKQPEAAQATDFGEPWKLSALPEAQMTDRDGCLLDIAQANRGIICTNALAGVPDPAEFVRQAKEAIREAERWLAYYRRFVPPMIEMTDDEWADTAEGKGVISSLSKLKPFLP